MERAVCPVCLRHDVEELFVGRDYLHGKAGEFPVVRCQNCNVIFVSPRPSQSEIGEYYPPEYTPHALAMRSNQRWISRIDYRYGLSKRCRAVMRYKKTGRILDVGCSTGEFLARARELGWEPRGIELSEYAADYAREQWGLDVFVGELERAPFPDGFFDAITLWNVFEHLFDPGSSLDAIYRLLSPGGVVVMTIPNLRSLDLTLFGRAWAGYDVPRHLYLFPLKTLSSFLVRKGFEIVSTRCLYGSYHAFFTSLQFCFRAQERLGLLRLAGFMSRSRLLRLLSMPYFFVLDRLKLGTVLTIAFRVRVSPD